MKLARRRFVPEILLVLSLVMSVVIAALCYWYGGRLLGLRSPEDNQVSVSAVAILATLFGVLPACVYIRHKLKEVHDRERLYECSICKLHFESEELAAKCEDWCKNNDSCNLEIAKQSIEARKNK